uniref:DUF1835 domain-containing protein n=1 Tax=Aromatoleum toluolicum TaxID=90060 RepID=A0ABX1NN54_9RHOO|nr:DUF1835 domain-containing protein [Aromatoleum toluolicum]
MVNRGQTTISRTQDKTRYRQAAEAARDGTVFIWTGAHSSSQLWLQRLCAVLPPTATDVRIVEALEPGAAPQGRGNRSTCAGMAA